MRPSLGRRFAALTLDWLACYSIVRGFGGEYSYILPLFIIDYGFFLALQGQSFGHTLLHIKIVDSATKGKPSLKQVLIRTFFLILVVTALTYDENGRGIHERLSGTESIRY